MPRKGGMDILRSFDRFADPVYLTLNHQKKIKTPCGGVLSLLVTAVVLHWLADQILTEYKGTFSSTSELVNLSENDTTPIYNITQDKLVIATRLQTIGDVVDQSNIDQYYGTVFVQYYYNGTTGQSSYTIYQAVACNTITIETLTDISTEEISNFNQAVKDMDSSWKCINWNNTTPRDLKVQGFSGGNTSSDMQQILIVQGTCQSMTNFTQTTDCVSVEESNANSWAIQSQVLSFEQLPNPDQIRKGKHQSTSVTHQRGFITQGFIENQTQMTSVRMQLTFAEYFLSWYSTSMDATTLTYYNTNTNIQNSVYQQEGIKRLFGLDIQAYVVYQMTLDASCYKSVYHRITILMLLSTFGGLMYTLKNIGNAFNKKGADFALDNLMMRKLYSVNIKDDPLYSKKNFPETTIEAKGLLYDYMNQRTSFFYSWKNCCCRCICNSPCCCSCFNCCCKRKDTVADRIFDKTKERMLHEIDLIQIVRQLRIASFMNQMNLQQYQINMIPFFSRYRITDQNSIYDAMAEHPGQIVKDIFAQRSAQVIPEGDGPPVPETGKKKMVLYEDSLEEVDKKKLANGLEANFDPYTEPKDLQMIKNVFGEDFDPSMVETIRNEIMAKPHEKINSANSVFMPKNEAKWDAHVPVAEHEPLVDTTINQT